MNDIAVRHDLPVEHCYRHGYVHLDGPCWGSSHMDHPRPLGVIIGIAAVNAVEGLIGSGQYAGPWSDLQLDLVEAFVVHLNTLVDQEHRNRTRNRPDTLAGTGPAPRSNQTPTDEGGGHHER